MFHQSAISLLMLLPVIHCHITIEVVMTEYGQKPVIKYYGESINPIKAVDIDKFKASKTLKQTLKDNLQSCPGHKWKEVTTITKPVKAFITDFVMFTFICVLPKESRIVYPQTVGSAWLNNEKEHKDKNILYKFKFPYIDPINHDSLIGKNFSFNSYMAVTNPSETVETVLLTGQTEVFVELEVQIVGKTLYTPHSGAEDNCNAASSLMNGENAAPAKYITTEFLSVNYSWIPKYHPVHIFLDDLEFGTVNFN